MTSSEPGRRPRDHRPGTALRTWYLTGYNVTFAALWMSVLIQAVRNATKGKTELFDAVEPRARWIQTASLVEVLHAATGLIKSPVGTTAIQVVTRVIQVWMVWFCFPESTASSRAFLALLLAWSTADAIRYAYLALNMHGVSPWWLVWLRYTMFFPLYPVGIGAEWWLMYLTIEQGKRTTIAYAALIYFLLALYAPGAYKMYMHMVKQRKKTLDVRAKIA